ncbi:LamG-like jellyroll fold domain-containing protein [Streptomyces sp. NPDC058330]|uniref:LamG domain-containing protein n=1 Tax=Streptomyces sp. NPDC058330 TaxID=3346449 RepID=UPI0036E75614
MPRTTFRVLTVALAAGMAVGTSLPAFAQSDRRPSRPPLDSLATGDRPCDVVTPTDVRASPILRAVLSDPDGDPVSAQFEVSWNTAGSDSPSRLRVGTTAKASGSPFSWKVPDTVPEGQVSWRVRAKDADGYGPWSDSQHQGRCKYLTDFQVPAAPQVTSPDLPLDSDAWVDAVGRYSSLTFATSSPDVTAYWYSFNGGATTTVRPDEPGAPVTVRLTPPSSGAVLLEVQALDAAGNVSAPTRHTIRVASPADSVARWKLADPAGSLFAEEAAGGQSAWAWPGVTFGADGPSGTSATAAAAFDGSYANGLRAEVTAADPTSTYTVSAWVRPEDTDRGMTAVSQTGFLAPSDFALGTTVGEDGQPSFAFSVPSATGGATRVTGGTPAPGEWSHLTGVHDPVAGTAQLYVDGTLAASGDAAVPEGDSHGYVEIGRELEQDGTHWTGAWHGDLADVRVWDRMVRPEEITDLGHRTPQRTGYWAMDTVRTDESYTDTPGVGGGQSLILAGDAHLDTTDPLTGEGSISLDGDGDHLDSDGHQVDTGRSYTVTAQVRLHEWAPDRDMALFSQGGDEADAFTLRYREADLTWEAVFAHADSGEAGTTTLTAPFGGGTRTFAVQYDSEAGQVRLFMNGHLTDSAPYSAADAWDAYRALQVGRDGAGRGGAHHLDGDVDEVRTYAGVLSASEIRTLSEPGEHPDL